MYSYADRCSGGLLVTLTVNLQFCASMWTETEVKKIHAIAEEARPGILFYALPHGLQVEQGPDAVVDHLVRHVPALLDAGSKDP